MHILNRCVSVLFSTLVISTTAYSSTLNTESDLQVMRHTVVSGDTLWDLSKRYLGNPFSYEAVKQLNNVANERLLQPGKELSFISTRFYPGIVMAVTGQVVQVNGAERKELRKGSLVEQGSVVQAADQSFAKLQFINQVQLEISPNSSVVFIASARDTAKHITPQLELERGAVELRVPPENTTYNKLEVISSELVLGVRGTYFRVKRDALKTINEVLSGRIAIARDQQQLAQVAGGEGLVFTPANKRIVHEKIAAKPSISRVSYDKYGLHFSVNADAQRSEYRVKLYNDAVYTVPVYELISTNGSFVLAPDIATDNKYHLSVTTQSANGLESYPLLYTYDQPQVSAVAVAQGVEFNFPYCDSEWRVQLSESKDFLIPAVNQSRSNICKVIVSNLPRANWYWRVFEGSNNDKDVGSGQIDLLSGIENNQK